MSSLVVLEHVWSKDENGDPESLLYARGDRVAAADVKELKALDVSLVEDESPEWHEAFNPDVARRAVSHQNDLPGHRRASVSEEEHAQLAKRVEELEAGVVSADEHQVALARIAELEAEKEEAAELAEIEQTEPPVEGKEEPVKPEDKGKRGPKEKAKEEKS